MFCTKYRCRGTSCIIKTVTAFFFFTLRICILCVLGATPMQTHEHTLLYGTCKQSTKIEMNSSQISLPEVKKAEEMQTTLI